MKRFVKAILKKLLKPLVSRYRFILDKLDKLDEVSYKQDRLGEVASLLYSVVDKVDKLAVSILSIQPALKPITDFPPAQGRLRKIQQVRTNGLFAFDRFCKENNLKYWICWGTLLGAVRHGGFIPWDDDIDVGMMREDFDKLIKIASGMPQNAKIQYWWVAGFLKIKYGMEDNFVFSAVDIFPFHQYYKRTTVEEGTRFKSLICQNVKENFLPHRPLLEMPYYGTPDEIKTMREIIMEAKNPIEEGDIFTVCGYKSIFRYEWIFPLKTMPFEGRELPVPNNPDKVLISDYGDYMMYPPNMYNWHGSISDNLKNNWRSHEKLDEFLSMDINDIYDLMTGRKK